MPQLEAGRELGPLKILHLLGSGGMADVYEAEDTRLGRHVAVKVLPEEYSRNADFIARFEREVKASAALSHTNIVTVFEFGTVDNLNYYTMRLLPGGDLRAKIAKGMSLVEILKTMRGVLQAFQHAHSRGFVHRDVKPENIMFDDQDTPTLTDFGIAKALDSHTRMTQTGMAVGTPRYISPEQAMGQEVDGRSDLYSLGCILYEMLTGQVPFKAETPIATIFQHVNEPVPQLDEEFGIFQDLLNTLMAKDPNDRLQDAQTTLALLDKTFPSDWTGTFDVSRLTGTLKSADGAPTPASTPIRAHTVDAIPADRKQAKAAAPVPDQGATQAAPVPAAPEGATQLLQATPVVDAEAGAGAKTQFVDAPRPKAKGPVKAAKAKKGRPKSTKPAARAESGGPPWLIIIVALILIGIAAAWFLGGDEGTPDAVVPTANPTPTPTPIVTPEPTQRSTEPDQEAQERKRRQQIEEQRRLQVLEQRRKREEAERRAAEDAKRQAEEKAKAEAEAKAKAQAEARAKAEADTEAKRKADAKSKADADAAARARAAEEARQRDAAQRKAREDELQRQRDAEARRLREDRQRKARADEAERLQREANAQREREAAAQREATSSQADDEKRNEELKKPVPIGF